MASLETPEATTVGNQGTECTSEESKLQKPEPVVLYLAAHCKYLAAFPTLDPSHQNLWGIMYSLKEA